MRESLVLETSLVPEPNDGRAVVTLAASEKNGHRFPTASKIICFGIPTGAHNAPP